MNGRMNGIEGVKGVRKDDCDGGGGGGCTRARASERI